MNRSVKKYIFRISRSISRLSNFGEYIRYAFNFNGIKFQRLLPAIVSLNLSVLFIYSASSAI
jgi:hypothetical protein